MFFAGEELIGREDEIAAFGVFQRFSDSLHLKFLVCWVFFTFLYGMALVFNLPELLRVLKILSYQCSLINNLIILPTK